MVLDLIDRNAIANNDFAVFVLGKMLCIIAILTMLIIFTRRYVAEVLGGVSSYTKVLSYGIYLFFFGSLIYAVYYFYYLSYINPEALAQERDFYLGGLDMILNNASAYPQPYVDMVKNEKEAYEKIYEGFLRQSQGSLAISSIGNYTMRGFLLCLITSIFLGRIGKKGV